MENLEKQKHGFPALLSFFIPGLGQLVKGQIGKAFLIWIIGGISGFFLWWTIIIPFGIWVWNVYDAYNSNTIEKEKIEEIWSKATSSESVKRGKNELSLLQFVLMNLIVFVILYYIYRFCLK